MLTQNNISVLMLQYSVMREETGPVLLPLVGLMAGRARARQAYEIWVEFENFKILCRLNYLAIYFVYYHCNVTTVLELHFSPLLSSIAY